MNKVAVYTGTRNLYIHMVPAIKSLLANSDVERVYLLIEDDEFPHYIPKGLVKTINMSDQKFFDMTVNPNNKSRFTYMAMIRTAFTKIFPELDAILSLDVDTFCINDISGIWNIPIDQYYFSAVKENPETGGCDGWNAGVMLQNLKKLRETGMDDILINRLRNEEIRFLDQTVYNQECKDAVYDMNPSYNVCEYCMPTKDPKIIHYAGHPNWHNFPEYRKWINESWESVLTRHEERIKVGL